MEQREDEVAVAPGVAIATTTYRSNRRQLDAIEMFVEHGAKPGAREQDEVESSTDELLAERLVTIEVIAKNRHLPLT